MSAWADRPRRFCMVTTFYPPFNFGGDGTYVHRLSNELARRGHSVDVIHCADAYRLLARTTPANGVANHPNVRVHTLKSRWGFLSPLATQQTGYPLFKQRRIREILEGTPFDVIHFHNVSLVGGPGILAYGDDAIKLYTLHEHWLVCPMHTLWKRNREVCVRPECLRCSLAYGRPPQPWRHTGLVRRAVRHVDAFLSPSSFTIAEHRRRGLDLPMVRLPNFLPRAHSAEAAPASAPSPNGARPYFLFVGRLERIKGLQTVIPLFRSYPLADLVIVGDGEYEAELRRLGARLPNVRFLGRVPHDELHGWYRHAIALLSPSVGYETFCMVVIEALAQRTPVIGRDLGGMGEVVRESRGGIVYRTEAELLEAMERLRLDVGLRAALGRAGYQSYLERWSEEPHLREYFSVIGAIHARREGAGTGHRRPDAKVLELQHAPAPAPADAIAPAAMRVRESLG